MLCATSLRLPVSCGFFPVSSALSAALTVRTSSHGNTASPSKVCRWPMSSLSADWPRECADWIRHKVEIPSENTIRFPSRKTLSYPRWEPAPALVGSSNFTVPGLRLLQQGNNIELKLSSPMTATVLISCPGSTACGTTTRLLKMSKTQFLKNSPDCTRINYLNSSRT